MELRQAEAERYKQLAKLRLGQLVTGEIVAGFAEADHRVGDFLRQREHALQALQHQLEEVQAKQLQLEAERESQRQRVAEASEQLDRAEAATQKRLQDDRAHQEQLQKARAADAVATQAEAKTAQAEQDRVEKGRPYEAEPLFMYLWKRGYGTADYAANPLVRFFDKHVAKLCHYHDARPNYAMLLEIPARLREHATQRRAAADREFEALTAIERAAAEDDGIPALREAVAAAERTIDAIDDRIQEAEQRVRQLMEAKASYAAGEDELFQQALAALVGQFEREGSCRCAGRLRRPRPLRTIAWCRSSPRSISSKRRWTRHWPGTSSCIRALLTACSNSKRCDTASNGSAMMMCTPRLLIPRCCP